VSFYLLGRRGPPSTGRPGGAITVRAGVSADVAEMSRLEGKAQERLTARLTAGDHCVVAFAGTTGAIVGYEWFTEGPRVVEDVTGYVIDVPPGGLYAYDGFIAAAFRGRGVFSRIQAGLAALMQDRGRERVITMVHADNETSLAANLRLGFRPYRAVRGLTLLGRRFFVEESLATA
jgi:GNAT superfamily N-acetyltransferase